MKRMLEMEDFSAPFSSSCCQVLPNFPVHGRLQGVFNGQRSAIDEEITLQRREASYAMEGIHKCRVVTRINVRVGDLRFRGDGKIVANLGKIEVRMVVADRKRAVETVEINELAPRHSVHHPAT